MGRSHRDDHYIYGVLSIVGIVLVVTISILAR